MRDSSKYPKKSVAVSRALAISSALPGGLRKNAHPRLFSARRSAAQPRWRANSRQKQRCLLGWVLLAANVVLPCMRQSGRAAAGRSFIFRKPSQDLKCRQVAVTRQSFQCLFPSLNTNGTPVNDLKTVEVFRVEASLGRTASLTEEDFLKSWHENIVGFGRPNFPDTNMTIDLCSAIRCRCREDAGHLFQRSESILSASLTGGGRLRDLETRFPWRRCRFPHLLCFFPRSSFSQDAVRLKWEPPAENLDGSKPARILGYNVYRARGFAEPS